MQTLGASLIIKVEFTERKIDTNPLMCLSLRRESPGTGRD